MIGAKYGDYGYDVFLICSVTVIGNRLAYITSIGWREFWLRKILVISILINKLCKNLLSVHFYSQVRKNISHCIPPSHICQIA
jgi:hypothetical protein